MDNDILIHNLRGGFNGEDFENQITGEIGDFIEADENKNINFMIPDFFLNNIDHGIFVILMYVIIILVCYKIENLYFRFLSFVIISAIITPKYGVSMAVIFFITTLDKPKYCASMLYIMLILISLFHIFIPIFSINFSDYGNYIFEIILFILTILIIWFNDEKSKKIIAKIKKFSTTGLSNLMTTNSIYDGNDSKELIFEN